MTINEDTTVRDLVVEYPQTRAVLESLGIDYCCGGRHPLAVAAKEAEVELPRVLAALNDAILHPTPVAGPARKDWNEATLAKLIEHIVDTHHAFMKRELPRVESLFAKVTKAHAKHHGAMLGKLHPVFSGLRAEIETHLMKEESILFPGIRRMEAEVKAGRPVMPMHCGSIHNPIAQMEREHENAGEALARMRQITGDYALPADACPTFVALYELLRAMEADLHEHIHMENNILFPKAQDMEGRGCA